MNKIVEDLQRHIASGDLKQGMEELFALLADSRETHPEAKEEVQQLRMDLLMLSGNLSSLDKRLGQGILAHDEYDLNRNRIRLSFIQMLDELPDYPAFFDYLEDLEEEQAWEVATQANTISAYEAYFNAYPKGKYAAETERIISELKDQIRKRASEEKERRKLLRNLNQDYLTRPPVSTPAKGTPVIAQPMDWWDSLPQVWQRAFKQQIGAIGPAKEKHIRRILGLKLVDLSDNPQITDLQPLRYMQSIKTLDLSATSIRSLTGLETLIQLEQLDISKTSVSDLEPLYGLKKLRSLVYTQVSSQSLRQFQQLNPDCNLIRTS